MSRLSRRRCTGDLGSAAVEMPLAVGLLLLPVAILVMVVPQWPERQTVARAAAKDAATVFANATDAESGRAEAIAVVSTAASNHGLPPEAVTVELTGDFCRACTVTASVTIDIPAVDVPLVGPVGSFTYTARSSARIDDYRSFEAEASP